MRLQSKVACPYEGVPSKKRSDNRIYFVGVVRPCACHDWNIKRHGSHHTVLCVSGIHCTILCRNRSVSFPPQLHSWGNICFLRVIRQTKWSFFLRKDVTVHLNRFRRISLQDIVPWYVWLLYRKGRLRFKPHTFPHCGRADTWTHHQKVARNFFTAVGLLHSSTSDELDELSDSWRVCLV